MPISSQGKRRSVDKANSSSKFVWRPSSTSTSSENLNASQNHQQQQQSQYKQKNLRKSNSSFQVKPTASKANNSSSSSSNNNKRTIRQISQPSSCATTSMALNNRLAEASVAGDYQQPAPLKSPTLSLAGQLILAGKQPASLETKASNNDANHSSLLSQPDTSKAPGSLSLMNAAGHHHNHHYKFNQNHPADLYLSRSSLSQHQHPSQASSTTQLQPNHHHHRHTTNPLTSRLNISSRNMNLKYVKTLIIILMALDLLMTILLHQFATHDQVQIWLTTYKLRFSLLNLVLSAIWFVILTAAILFDVHFILVIACIVDVGSFVLLLVLSIVHFYKRIDYNTVQLTSLLALLFSIVFLHVYLLAMSVLTIYLTGAVRGRKRSNLSAS